MELQEHVRLSVLTTLRVGGAASFLARCKSEEDVRAALAFANERGLPWRVLGGGSNVLAADEGFAGVIIRMELDGSAFDPVQDDAVIATLGAGVGWDTFVRESAARGLWGVENLAGIPGTVGAAPVQNIGAYGSETKDTIVEVRALDTRTGQLRILPSEACGFGYRDSRFKQDASLIILSVSFRLSYDAGPKLTYADLARAQEAGADLSSPAAVGETVRAIRAKKFPDLSAIGTAGSFFKNPVITKDAYDALVGRYPELPSYPATNGVKIPLAFILDRVIGLRGYRDGSVALFEAQPLVLVAHEGATARDIDAFANDVASRVHDATGITIEREVRLLP